MSLAPVFVSVDSYDVAENTIFLFPLVEAYDPDGDPEDYIPIEYTIVSSEDDYLFDIDSYSGELYFQTEPDYEAPADHGGDNVYHVRVRATDGNGDYSHLDITIYIYDVDEDEGGGDNFFPPFIFSPPFASVPENSDDVVYTAMAYDPDGGDDPIFFYITGGADAALFSIDPYTGEVTFNTAPDFEMPGDADGDNVYEIEITAFDHDYEDASDPLTVLITVTDENDNAPEITSGGAASVPENTADVVYLATATDADADSVVTFAISGGADAALFYIDETTGEVYFVSPPDFEAPGDADYDNVYEIEITAYDGENYSDPLAVSITVEDENDNTPVITSGTTASVMENSYAIVYQAEATDADADDVVTFGLGGADAALFSIDPTTGEVWLVHPLDYEDPQDTDGDNVYEIEVYASDGVHDADPVAVSVTVENENDNVPVITSGTTASVMENSYSSVYLAEATDADGDPVTFSLGGADAALFTIDADTGEVWLAFVPDHEAPQDADGDNVYEIEIYASDGDYDADPVALSITVEDENDNVPMMAAYYALTSVPENTTGTVYTAVATDADASDELTYFISGGADAALFAIDPVTGELTFIAPPDFEAPADADHDNVYEVEISASDGTYDADALALSVTVTDVAEGTNIILGTPGPDYLLGTSAPEVLKGLAGNDTLVGGAGPDTMIGGDGDDIYYVDTPGEIVIEQPNAGNDTIIASVSRKLSPNVENLILTGTASIGLGNELDNHITGNDAPVNYLNGGEGADTMIGGAGNDYYWVDNPGDLVIENENEGIDGVSSTISYTLTANVENLKLLGTDDIDGTGNELANNITGNSGNNVLDGKGGADFMRGGDGDDTYYVDDSGDITFEASALGGIDTVISSVSRALGAHLENLTLTGTASIGIGNELDNIIIGNDANNMLRGGAGNDTLTGGGGNDGFFYNAPGFGIDTITDFEGGPGIGDRLNVQGTFLDFADVMAHTIQDGADTVITVDAFNKIILANFTASTLVANDFVFLA